MRERVTYLDADTGVLSNLLGARTEEGLAVAEHDIVIVRHVQLTEQPLPGDLDFEHLRAMHRFLFGDVYPFACEVRRVDLRKVGDPMRPFAPARVIEAMASRIFAELRADEFLAGRSRSEFVDGLEQYFTTLNFLHPFREGNGRTLRLFLAELAVRAGWTLDWTRIDRAENLAASCDPVCRAREMLDRVVAGN